ncbi:MAG: LytTR family transcriptional regulator DNA-binding domain-containing protein [Janthinobacterium lividum]
MAPCTLRGQPQALRRAGAPGCFLRTHRSFLVNTAHITAVTADEVRLGATHAVPLGQSFREAVLAQVVQQHLVRR